MAKVRQIALAVVSLVATTQVKAIEVLFDYNADPNYLNGGAIAGAIQIASDFAVEQNSVLTNVRFWTMEGTTPNAFPTGSAWNGYITYTLWNDVAGTSSTGDSIRIPSKTPVAEGILNCNSSPSSCSKAFTSVTIPKDRDPISPYEQYVYDFELLEPFRMSAYRRYWLGIYLDNGVTDSVDSHGILWQYNIVPPDALPADREPFGEFPRAYPLSLGLPSDWPFPISQETAFELSGFYAPVPPTAALLSTGLIVLRMRWRSTAVAS